MTMANRLFGIQKEWWCDLKGWGSIQFMEKSEERQDTIGEKIAKLLNNYDAETEI